MLLVRGGNSQASGRAFSTVEVGDECSSVVRRFDEVESPLHVEVVDCLGYEFAVRAKAHAFRNSQTFYHSSDEAFAKEWRDAEVDGGEGHSAFGMGGVCFPESVTV